MRLVPIDEKNRNFYQNFETAKDLSLYMSRIYPDFESPYLKWMYIEEDQRYIGSIWLEGKEIHVVKLGIFIADSAYRDKGIGRRAIQQMLAMAQNDGIHKITLNVRVANARARKVYSICGFKIKEKYRKENGINAFSMEFKL